MPVPYWILRKKKRPVIQYWSWLYSKMLLLHTLWIFNINFVSLKCCIKILFLLVTEFCFFFGYPLKFVPSPLSHPCSWGFSWEPYDETERELWQCCDTCCVFEGRRWGRLWKPGKDTASSLGGRRAFWKWYLARVSCGKEEDLSSVRGSERGGDGLWQSREGLVER